ncbi:hypothetical protein P3T27_006167 [Kitasatospora sp. MAA19]|nr:hypothetical protein [Kitasatospora sp. MAA19]
MRPREEQSRRHNRARGGARCQACSVSQAGDSQSGNTTVERTLTTLVTVTVPDLEVTNLYVKGTLSTLRLPQPRHPGAGLVQLQAVLRLPGHGQQAGLDMTVFNDKIYLFYMR